MTRSTRTSGSGTTRARRTWVGLAAAAAVACALAGVAPASAAEGGTGSVHGVVTGPGGPIAGVTVIAHRVGSAATATTTTAANGTYTLQAAAGAHVMEFDGSDVGYVPEYYDDALTPADADPVTVVADALLTGIDATLAVGGTVSGTVTGPGGPVAGATVTTVTADGALPMRAATTAADGTYVLDGVTPGAYLIRADGTAAGLTALFHPAALGRADATVVVVTAGASEVGVDVALADGGRITGTVTGPGGVPVAGVIVRGYPSSGSAPAETVTAADGTYQLVGLPITESYVVEFDGGATHHTIVWYDQADTVGGAQQVEVSAGGTTGGIDAVLASAGTVAGAVTVPGGAPAPGVVVNAYEQPYTGRVWAATTAADGTYVVGGLPTGSYLVKLDGSPAGLVSEVYDDRLHESEADLVAVTAGATHGDVDAELALGGGVAGTVTGSGGPVNHARVFGLCGSYFQSTYTGPDGSYVLDGLPPGACVVQFNASSQGFVTEFYDDALVEAEAESLTIVVGVVTAGTDAELAFGGSISGLITGPGGPVHATVHADDPAAGTGSSSTSGMDGTFTVGGLPPGEYVVHVVPVVAGLRSEYYDDSLTRAGATPVVVGGNEHVTGIDVELSSTSVPLFSDVLPGHPFYDEIDWLAAQGITTGYPDGTFHPSAPVARQAMAAFLYRFAGEPAFTPPAEPTFDDVPAAAPFFAEIEWLASTGITTGWPDGTFRPAASVERQAMAAFLYRFAGEPAFSPPAVASFRDVPTTAPFFAEVEWLASTGITTGWPDHTFRPTALVERQALAAFLMRFDTWLSS